MFGLQTRDFKHGVSTLPAEAGVRVKHVMPMCRHAQVTTAKKPKKTLMNSVVAFNSGATSQFLTAEVIRVRPL